MTLTVHNDLAQGSDEWLEARRGILTASVIGQLITPSTRKVAANVTTRALTAELAAERITGWVDDHYASGDMERGHEDEPLAVAHYAETQGRDDVHNVGFMKREWEGHFTIGYSPDQLVGEYGCLEVKSRRPKKHLQTILADEVPAENIAQIQCALLVSERDWCDYVSHCGGMPQYVKRVYPDFEWFDAIRCAAEEFETGVADIIARYNAAVDGLPTTERIDHNELGLVF